MSRIEKSCLIILHFLYILNKCFCIIIEIRSTCIINELLYYNYFIQVLGVLLVHQVSLVTVASMGNQVNQETQGSQENKEPRESQECLVTLDQW